MRSSSATDRNAGQPETTNVHGQRTRWRRRARTVRVLGAVAVCTALAVGSGTPVVSGAGVVDTTSVTIADRAVLNDWNLIAQTQTIPLRPTAHGQTRGMAMVQGAVYDAVNAINRGYEPYLLDVDALGIDPSASYGAAIATAAHHVLVAIVPSTQAAGLDAAYEATLADIPDGPSRAAGVAAGEAAAAAMIVARTGDGFLAPFEFVIGPDPGDWRPVTPAALDPDAWVGGLRPFLIQSPAQFRSEGPNPLTSAAYTQDFNEVKDLGSLTSATRTADQTTAAIFWQSPPVGMWNTLSRDLSSATDLDTVEEARLLAMVNLAAADGAIACWNDKYSWNFWRPMAAIREADTDGNPDTLADTAWKPLFDPSTPTSPPLATPPFPDHPSGHGCISGAVLHTAREFFGTDKVGFDVYSSRFPGRPRHFDRLSAALKEIIDARVWGGIHFRTADVQGTVIGKKVAHWLDTHSFRASAGHGRDAARQCRSEGPPLTRPQWNVTPEVLDRFFDANPTSSQAPVWAVNRDRAWHGYQIAAQRHGCRLHAAGR